MKRDAFINIHKKSRFIQNPPAAGAKMGRHGKIEGR